MELTDREKAIVVEIIDVMNTNIYHRVAEQGVISEKTLKHPEAEFKSHLGAMIMHLQDITKKWEEDKFRMQLRIDNFDILNNLINLLGKLND